MILNRLITLCIVSIALAYCSTPNYKKEQISLIPKPVNLTVNEGSFRIKKRISISVENDAQKKAANFLHSMFKTATGFDLNISENQKADIDFQQMEGMAPETYKLEVTPKGIKIAASDEAGYLYGVQTIRQLLPKTIESKTNTKIKSM